MFVSFFYSKIDTNYNILLFILFIIQREEFKGIKRSLSLSLRLVCKPNFFFDRL